MGRVPGPGRRQRGKGQDLDPRAQGRRDLFPAAAVAAFVDRRQAGDRRWRGRGPRRGRAPGFLAPPDQARPEGGRRPRLPAVRPALSRWPASARCPARGSQATAPERAQGPPAGALRVAHRRRRRGVLRGRGGQPPGGHDRQAPTEPVRAGQAIQGLAEAEGPARAGAGHRRVDAGRGQRPGSRRAGGGLLRRRQAEVRRQGRVGLHRRGPQGAALEAQAARGRRLALRRTAAEGLQGSMGRRSGVGDLGPARARDARGARRLDA